MAQPPGDYGWSIPSDFSQMNQNPYTPAPVPQSGNYWQQQPQPGVPMAPMPYGGDIGFSMDAFNDPPAPTAPPVYQPSFTPSAAPGGGDYHYANTEPSAPPPMAPPTQPHSDYVISNHPTVVVSRSRESGDPAEDPARRVDISGAQRSPKPVKRTPSNRDGELHRTDASYKEGLQNMADLMTDIDLNEEVLNAVKHRFALDK